MKRTICFLGIFLGAWSNWMLYPQCLADIWPTKDDKKEAIQEEHHKKVPPQLKYHRIFSSDEKRDLIELAKRFNKEQSILKVSVKEMFHPSGAYFACVEFQPKPIDPHLFELSQLCAAHRAWTSGRGEKSSVYVKTLHPKERIVTKGPWLTTKALYSTENKGRFVINQKEYFIHLIDTDDYSEIAALLTELSQNHYYRENNTKFSGAIPLDQITVIRKEKIKHARTYYHVHVEPVRWVWHYLTFELKNKKWTLIAEGQGAA